MLRSLRVWDFAVVEEATLEFSNGFNVLTGETGAGKSILMEALVFLIGGRGSASWIRPGADALKVEAIFDRADIPAALQKKLKKPGETVHIRREIDSNGKSRAFLEETPVPASALAEIGEILIDFHGQNQHQKLLKTSFQREWLDSFLGLEDLLKETAEVFESWSSLTRELESSNLSEAERAEKLDFLRFRLAELEGTGLKEGEDLELEAVLPVLKNVEKLRSFSFEAHGELYAFDGAVLTRLLNASRAIAELAKIDPSLKNIEESVASARGILEDASRTLSAYQNRLEAGPEKIDSVLERLDQISRLKKKYGKDIPGLLAEKGALALEISRFENRDQSRAELEVKKDAARAQLRKLSQRLHERRVKGGKRLSQALISELKELGLAHAELNVAVEMEEESFHRFGSDEVDFLFSANPGAGLRPLRETVSGGELSRVMLALKTVLAKADRTPVLIFDEVDAGVGGFVARAVGQKLAALAGARQVLCVTHLPQIACLARRHFHLSKKIQSGRANTKVEVLEGGQRLEALAVMLGGAVPTEASRRHAQELLEGNGSGAPPQKSLFAAAGKRKEEAGKKS